MWTIVPSALSTTAPDDGIPAAQDTNKAGLFDFGGGRQGTVYFFFLRTLKRQLIQTNLEGARAGKWF